MLSAMVKATESGIKWYRSLVHGRYVVAKFVHNGQHHSFYHAVWTDGQTLACQPAGRIYLITQIHNYVTRMDQKSEQKYLKTGIPNQNLDSCYTDCCDCLIGRSSALHVASPFFTSYQ